MWFGMQMTSSKSLLRLFTVLQRRIPSFLPVKPLGGFDPGQETGPTRWVGTAWCPKTACQQPKSLNSLPEMALKEAMTDAENLGDCMLTLETHLNYICLTFLHFSYCLNSTPKLVVVLPKFHFCHFHQSISNISEIHPNRCLNLCDVVYSF